MTDENDLPFDQTLHPSEASSAPGASRAQIELTPGLSLNNTYRLVSLLGRGGMGEVWKAEHLRLPKPVAIKVLLADVASSEEVAARFRREAEIGSRLAHPHIVHVFDFNELPDGRKYIAMDFLEGESLADRMDRGPIPYKEAVHILQQTAQGLQVAHDAGVVHRDLKPDNIFLAAEPSSNPPFRVKILDFGISKIQNAERTLTQDMAVMGTPGYMAPEQARGQTATLGPEADQFSLATIAYEMVSGSPAFEGQTLVEIIFKLVHEDPAPLDAGALGAPAHVSAALGRAMAKDPKQRFDTIQSFVATFAGNLAPEASRPDAVLEADPYAATHSSSQPGAPLVSAAREADERTPARSRRIMMIGAGVALAGLAMATFAWNAAKESTGDEEPTTQGRAEQPPASLPVTTPTHDADEEVSVRDADPPSDAARVHDAETARDAGPPQVPAKQQGAARPPKQAPVTPKVSPQAQALLDQAQAALQAGDGSRALTLAQRAFRTEQVPQARAAMAMAYCLKRDRGASNAARRGLRGALATKVAKFCISHLH